MDATPLVSETMFVPVGGTDRWRLARVTRRCGYSSSSSDGYYVPDDMDPEVEYLDSVLYRREVDKFFEEEAAD